MFKRILFLASLLFSVIYSAQAGPTAKIGLGPLTAYCTYTSFNFIDSSTYSGANSGFNSSKWYFGDGGTASGTMGSNYTHIYTATGTYIVSLVVTNSKDPSKDSTTRSITITLKGANPAFAMVGRYCQRSEIDAQNQSVAPGSPVTTQYFWDFGDGSKVNTQNPGVHVYQLDGTYKIVLKDSTSQKCVSTVSKTIVINKTPQAKWIVKQHCQDSSTFFDASSTVTQGLSVSYSWTFQDSTVQTGVTTSKLFSVSKTYLVKLGVTNKTNGCNDTGKVSFTVYSKPQVNFGYLPVCQDSIAMFFDSTYIAHGDAYTWHWTFADSLLHNYSDPTDYSIDKDYVDTVFHGFPHGGRFYVTLTVESRQGCIDSTKKLEYINPTPKPDFAFKNTCQDSAFQFYDSSKVAAGNKITGWLWYFGDSASKNNPYTSTLQNPTHKYAKPGYKYKVKLIAITNSGCRDSITKTVTAWPSPDSKFAFTSKCAKDPISFVDNSSMSLEAQAQGDYITNYFWDFADGKTDSVQNSLHPFRDSGTYKVRFAAFSSHGCADTVTKDVLVFALPQPSFKLVGNCERDSVSFVNTSKATYGVLIDSSYTWDFGDSVIVRNVKNPKHRFLYSGIFKVKLSATTRDTNGLVGCSKDTVIQVTIIPGPHSSFTWNASCFNQPVIFNNTTFSKDPRTIKYKWDFGDGFTDTAKNPVHTYTSIKNYKPKLVSLMPATGCNDSVSLFVSVAPIPKAMFYAKNVCNDSSVIFTDSSKLAPNYYFKSYVYDFGDGQSDVGANPTHKYAKPGTYTVKEVVTSTTNCQDSFTRVIRTYGIPTARFGGDVVCAGTPTTFLDTTAASDSVVLWQWLYSSLYKDSLTINDSSHAGKHIYFNSDILTAQLKVSTKYGCSNTKTIPVKIYLQPDPFFSVPIGCNNRPIQFRGFNNNKLNTNVASYEWDFGDGQTSPDSNTLHTFDSSKYYNVVLKETSNQGCVATFMKPVYITQIGLPTISYLGGCVGETFYFFDTSRITVCPTCQAVWDFGDGSGPLFDPHPSHKYLNSGAYLVKLYEDNYPFCTSDTVYAYVIAHPLPTAKFAWDTACFGDPTRFIDQSDPGDSLSIISKYNWRFQHRFTDTINKNPFYTYPDTFLGPETSYKVTLKVTSDFGCNTTDSADVYVKQRPRASFRPNANPIVIQYPTVYFTNTSLYADTSKYYWNFGDSTDSHLANPSHKYNDTGTYYITLSAMSRRGCPDTFRYTLYVVPGYTIFAPNCMTVNGDGLNDEWKAKGVGVIDYDVVIVDRWGQIVFHSTDINEPWKGEYNNNGVKCPEGVFRYHIKAGDFANYDFTKLDGTITLLR